MAIGFYNLEVIVDMGKIVTVQWWDQTPDLSEFNTEYV